MAAPKRKSKGQEALIPAAHVKFTGMSTNAVEQPAELGDEQVFTVRARCTYAGTQLREDGEERAVRTMKVIDVRFGEITPRPVDPQLSLLEGEGLGDDGDDAGDDDDGDPDPE